MAVFGREQKESYLLAGLPAMDRSIDWNRRDESNC
jgi:hypothetical protein